MKKILVVLMAIGSLVLTDQAWAQMRGPGGHGGRGPGPGGGGIRSNIQGPGGRSGGGGSYHPGPGGGWWSNGGNKQYSLGLNKRSGMTPYNGQALKPGQRVICFPKNKQPQQRQDFARRPEMHNTGYRQYQGQQHYGDRHYRGKHGYRYTPYIGAGIGAGMGYGMNYGMGYNDNYIPPQPPMQQAPPQQYYDEPMPPQQYAAPPEPMPPRVIEEPETVIIKKKTVVIEEEPVVKKKAKKKAVAKAPAKECKDKCCPEVNVRVKGYNGKARVFVEADGANTKVDAPAAKQTGEKEKKADKDVSDLLQKAVFYK